MSEKREFILNEQKSSMENFNSKTNNNYTNPSTNHRNSENSEILKQMKDMSEVIKVS
jgi:hypothetical protein